MNRESGRPFVSTLPTVAELTALLETLIPKHNVPGASVAVCRGEELITSVAGVLNVNTGVEVTTDSVFQIGSVSKIFTASLVMQLVDEGTVDLDSPIETYLPDFRLAGGAAAGQITLRHLLTHTSGIDGGDYISDFGRGDDAVAKYVASLSEIGLVHPVGKYRSYCNAGTVVAGRIVEVLTGLPWHSALQARLLDPLGLTHTVTLPEQAILFRVAAGHVPTSRDDQTPRLHPTWMLPRSMGPAGSVINSTATDLAAFGRLHLDGGVGPDGAVLLSGAGIEAMQEPQFRDAFRVAGSSGIGWGLGEQEGVRTVAHDGGTLGQNSLFVLFPEHDVVFACLTNGAAGGSVCAAMLKELRRRLTVGHDKVEPAASPPDAGVSPPFADLALYAGVFERKFTRTTIELVDGALQVRNTYSGFLTEKPAERPTILRPIEEGTFAMLDDEGRVARKVAFTEPDEVGRPQYLIAGRLSRRVS